MNHTVCELNLDNKAVTKKKEYYNQPQPLVNCIGHFPNSISYAPTDRLQFPSLNLFLRWPKLAYMLTKILLIGFIRYLKVLGKSDVLNLLTCLEISKQ